MNTTLSRTTRFVNKLLYLGSAALMLAAIALSAITGSAAATGNSGAIWTTDGSCGTSSQNVNQYLVGEHVYINFSGFAAGTYNWQIKQTSGNPKPIVASGTYVVGASGAGCFDAYTVQLSEVDHEYSVKLGNKNDNYRVCASTSATATGTPIASSTSTSVPTATNTIVSTATNTIVPTATNTIVPTATGTTEPSATSTAEPTATATTEPSATSTAEPTATETTEPNATSTTEPTATEETQSTEVSDPTATPTEGPESTQVSDPTATPQLQVTPTDTTRKIPTALLLDVGIDPFCTFEGAMQWTVINANASNIIMNRFTVDGVNHDGFVVTPGEHDLVTTPLGTHTVRIYFNEAGIADLTYTIDVCPLLIPVTGNEMLIPVTGANQSNSLGLGLGLGSFSLAGFGLVLSSLRKRFHL